MNTAHDYLAEIARAGAGRFASTSLASSHAGVTLRVRRHRTARAAVTTVAGIGVIGGATWGLDAFRSGAALAPGATSTATATASHGSSPTPSSAPEAQREHTMTIPGGKTLAEISATLADAYGVSTDDAREAIDAAVHSAVPQATTSEGWVKPGEYTLDTRATLDEAAAALVGVRVAEFTSLAIPAAQWQEVLTKASLVEREAKLDVDKPKVARVIQNRLDQGMKLELDSTVKFVVPDEGAFTTDADRATDSPYNTYLYQGLPPGAIGSPSDISVDAVLHPAAGDWLFFVTVNFVTGETAYATTFEEHLANAARQQEWLDANGG